MSTSRGVDATRRVLNPGSGIQQEIHDAQTQSPANVFLRAVVVRVINDPLELTTDVINELKKELANPAFLDKVPRNSLIIRIITGGQDRRNGQSLIAYPFLPSHFSLPVKTGEQVWVTYENPQSSGALPFWMWRISEPSHVEDLNYTHGDRKYDSQSAISTSEKTTSSSSPKVPGFLNGGGNSTSWSLKGENDYEDIIGADPAYEDFTPEAVPRFTKRPGDAVLQGSNNTLIVLGEERKGPAKKEESEKKKSAGTIDIVAGRGRFPPEPGAEPENTAARSIENSRKNIETDKNPVNSGKKDNKLEGDPDYVRDASRLFVGINLDGDKLFDLSGKMPEPFQGEIVDEDGKSYAVAKADQVRIIGRKDSANDINGSVRIIKEGDVGGDQAALLMLPDGTVILDGEIIFIGRPGGEGPGPSGSEPYIKFSKYKEHLTSIIDALSSVMQSFIINFALPVAAPGQPHPGLTSAIADVTKAKVDLEAVKAVLDQAQSTRIFGE